MDDSSMLENVKTFKGKIIYHCESDTVKPLWRVTANYGTSTNVGPTNVGLYKGRTVQTSDLQTPDWYKRRTGTNVGLRQTSD